jgi:nucleoside-diphosphate-sugar epimerase
MSARPGGSSPGTGASARRSNEFPLGRHTGRFSASGNYTSKQVVHFENNGTFCVAVGDTMLPAGAVPADFDLSSPELPQAGFGCDALVHCAWGDVWDHNSVRHIDEHLMNSYRFIRSAVAHGIRKIVVTGTSWEYGEVYGPISAAVEPHPQNSYGFAKHVLHQMLRAAQRSARFDLVWARLFYVYGDDDDAKGLIAQFDRALERGDRTFDMSYGEQLYDFLPIDQGAEQIASLVDAPDGTYNVCSGKPISLRRLLEQRMREKGRLIELNLGNYPYRERESIALWGADSVAWRR